MSTLSSGNQRHDRQSTSRPCGTTVEPRRQADTGRWSTIRYALDSNSRTVRLCVIALVTAAPPAIITLLLGFHH
jgi:hypothetical protein